MKALSVLFASAIAGVVILVLVGLTILLTGYSPFGGLIGSSFSTCGLLLIPPAGGFFGAWFYGRLARSVTVGRGALVGGLGGLFSVVLPIFLYIALYVFVLMLPVVFGAFTFRESVEFQFGMTQQIAQAAGIGVVEVVSVAAIIAGLYTLLGALGGTIGGFLFQEPATAVSGGDVDETTAHPADSPPAERARPSGA